MDWLLIISVSAFFLVCGFCAIVVNLPAPQARHLDHGETRRSRYTFRADWPDARRHRSD